MLPLCLHDAPTSRLSHIRLGTGHRSDRLASPQVPYTTQLHATRSPASGQGGSAALHPVPPPPPVPYLFVPDLQGLAADAIEDGEEAALERVFEHLAGGLLFGRAAAT